MVVIIKMRMVMATKEREAGQENEEHCNAGKGWAGQMNEGQGKAGQDWKDEKE